MNSCTIIYTHIVVCVCIFGLCSYTAPRAWVSLTMPSATAYVRATGLPVEWEWVDLAQTTLFLEGDVRWRSRGGGYLTDQNSSRVVGPLLVSVLSKWLHDAWVAAVVMTWVAWCACVWAVVALVRRSSWIGTTEIGRRASCMTAIVLTVTASGFLGNVGDIDAHVVGYAGAALGILVTLRWTGESSIHRERPFVRPEVVGVSLFVLDGTLQLGVPLSALVCCMFVYHMLFGPSSGRLVSVSKASRMFSTFGVCWLLWWLLARIGSDGQFEFHNEAIARSREALSDLVALGNTLPGKVAGVLGIALSLFEWWMIVPAVLGWIVADWETRFWTFAWFGLIVGATVLTRYTASTVYLVFPSMYVLASIGAGAIAELGRRVFPLAREGGYVNVLIAVGSAMLVSLVPAISQLAFIWGDYTMPAVWWPGP